MTDDRYRVLVVEDDPDAAAFTRIALERYGGMDVVVARDADAALRELAAGPFDLLVSDIELPGRSGLEILPEVHALDPGLPVMVVTAHGSVTHAVDALRQDVEEFLVKPVTASRLVERAAEIARGGRARRASRPHTRVLAVGAHPDDVEVGVGGILAAHAAAGDELVILTLSPGGVGGEAGVRSAPSRGRWASRRP